MTRRDDRYRDARRIFKGHGGTMKTQEALRAGIHPRILYAMRDEGLIVNLSRGLFRRADLPPLGNPDLVAVAGRVPQGVVCLISALAFHELTTQIPHEVYLALERGARPPRITYPPIRIFWFKGAAFHTGIETRQVDGVPVRVYGPEKTLADCFKYRNRIGLDVALEALRLYVRRKGMDLDRFLHFARTCRVERVLRPYLEALL